MTRMLVRDSLVITAADESHANILAAGEIELVQESRWPKVTRDFLAGDAPNTGNAPHTAT